MLSLSIEQKRWCDFVKALVLVDLKTRYRKTVLGFVWLGIEAVLQMLVTGIVLQFFIKIKGYNYFEFLLPGLLLWDFFSGTVSRSTSVFVDERMLVQKSKFPKEVLVVSIVIVNLLRLLVAIIIVVLFECFVGLRLHWWRWCLLAPIAVWLSLFAGGLSLLFSTLYVKYRDVGFVVRAVLPLWFYVTPVLYDINAVPVWLRALLRLNPMTAIVEVVRWAILGMSINWAGVWWSLLLSVVIGLMAVKVYRKESLQFDDWL
jgi:lipopolysaccharide transport system permease protein